MPETAFVISIGYVFTYKMYGLVLYVCMHVFSFIEEEQALLLISLHLINFIFRGSNECSLTSHTQEPWGFLFLLKCKYKCSLNGNIYF